MSRFTFDTMRWTAFRNDDADEVPAHGVMMVTDTVEDPDGHPCLVCEQPDGTGTVYAVNGPSPVPSGDYGVCATLGSGIIYALCNASVVTPEVGQEWGPTSGSWAIVSTGFGFLCYGGPREATATSRACFQMLHLPIKPLVRFTLGAALTTSDASKSATISDQYGRGRANSTSITVHNSLDNSGLDYIFFGDSGDAGLAIHNTGTNYIIVNMECP